MLYCRYLELLVVRLESFRLVFQPLCLGIERRFVGRGYLQPPHACRLLFLPCTAYEFHSQPPLRRTISRFAFAPQNPSSSKNLSRGSVFLGEVILDFKMAERPFRTYGQGIGSSYQEQGLALSKQFKKPITEAIPSAV